MLAATIASITVGMGAGGVVAGERPLRRGWHRGDALGQIGGRSDGTVVILAGIGVSHRSAW